MLRDLMAVTDWVMAVDVPKGSLMCFVIAAALFISAAVGTVSDWCDKATEGPYEPNPLWGPVDYQALLDGHPIRDGQVRRWWRR